MADELEEASAYTTKVHRSLTRWDRKLFWGCNRKAFLDTVFGGGYATWVASGFSFLVAMAIGYVAVRRIQLLRALGRQPYGYEIAQKVSQSRPIYPRGRRAFARTVPARKRAFSHEP